MTDIDKRIVRLRKDIDLISICFLYEQTKRARKDLEATALRLLANFGEALTEQVILP